jgi:hypothetical protein
MKHLKVNISKATYIESYLQVLNGIIKLSPYELNVLANCLIYDSKVFGSSDSRTYVLKATGLKNGDSLNTYIRKLKAKKCLIPIQGKKGFYTYNPKIDPANYKEGVNIKFEYANS